VNRYKATLEWVTQLTNAGESNMRLVLTVPLTEWAEWIREDALVRKYSVEPMGKTELQFHGPSNIIVHAKGVFSP